MLRRISLLLVLLGAPQWLGAQHHHEVGDATRLGKVNFPTSCAPEVRPQFERGLALLHSFWYAESEKAFTQVAAADPQCAIAYWGIAMSITRPLWEMTDKEALRRSRETLRKADAAGKADERERAYIAAIRTFYGDEPGSQLARTQGYEQAMKELVAQFPQDDEAKMFYALSLLWTATASPPDKTYPKQKQAGAILEPLLPRYPEHPGLAHYIIHSYDFPPLADRGAEAARRYAKIAPDSPHALHMPSHIFTRLGLWDDSIASNLDSAAAGRKYNWPGEELHAMDYLVYAYLQQGQDAKAKEILGSMPTVKASEPSMFAGLFARAAIPARYVLERRRWEEAAALEIPAGVFPGGRYAWTEANFHFARALGAAHSGKLDAAKQAIAELAAAHKTLLEANERGWAGQVEVQRLTAEAWLSLKQGNTESALKLMREAADREDTMDKHPVTPGALTPARELLAEMLLELKRPAEAVREFETVLASSPGRFNALYGAGHAAQLAGDAAKAKTHFSKLVQNCQKADTERSELREARALLVASAP
jgi:tetratricopeptide (TPR) repeat protein